MWRAGAQNRRDAGNGSRKPPSLLERPGSQGSAAPVTCRPSPAPKVSDDASQMRLTPDTLLQLAPDIRTRLDVTGHVLIDAPAGTVLDAGPSGFATLSLFSRPLAIGGAIERLEAEQRGTTEFLPTMSVINALLDEGVLVESGGCRTPITGWADPVEHARMLDDSRRTHDYIAALQDAVRPDDIRSEERRVGQRR